MNTFNLKDIVRDMYLLAGCVCLLSGACCMSAGTSTISNVQPVPVALHYDAALLRNNQDVQFIPHEGPGPWDSALAMNIQYAPILSLREQIGRHIGVRLKFYTAWDARGEAHITTISPIEYYHVLKKYITIQRINEIAEAHHIQGSDVEVLGIGSGAIMSGGNKQETFFVLVASKNLRTIRKAVHKEYIRNGGPAQDFDPDDFEPHITIGYTLRDLHRSDGLIKDVRHSLDTRFQLHVGD